MPLPGLSPVAGKSVVAKFDGDLLSSDGGILALRECEQHLLIADRLAGRIEDSRAPNQITHSLADITRFRLLTLPPAMRSAATQTLCVAIFKMAQDLQK